MAPVYGIQPTFAGGEFSPSLWSRVDFQKYSTGLKTAKNFFIHPHGGASNRPGLRYIAATKNSSAGDSNSAILVPFIFSATQAYILEFGNGYIRFFNSSGQITSAGSPYQVSTGWTGTTFKNLKFAQSADTLYIVSDSVKPKTLVRYSDTNWVLSDYVFNNGPFYDDKHGFVKKIGGFCYQWKRDNDGDGTHAFYVKPCKFSLEDFERNIRRIGFREHFRYRRKTGDKVRIDMAVKHIKHMVWYDHIAKVYRRRNELDISSDMLIAVRKKHELSIIRDS